MSTTSGHCLCGDITFLYEGVPNWTLHCHCESCRRATSSPIVTWISVPRDAFHFTAGTPRFFVSSSGVQRGFCGRCGSPLTYENARLPDEIHLLACALSDPEGVKPTCHVFVGEQLSWFDTVDDLPRYKSSRRNAEPIRHGPRK